MANRLCKGILHHYTLDARLLPNSWQLSPHHATPTLRSLFSCFFQGYTRTDALRDAYNFPFFISRVFIKFLPPRPASFSYFLFAVRQTTTGREAGKKESTNGPNQVIGVAIATENPL